MKRFSHVIAVLALLSALLLLLTGCAGLTSRGAEEKAGVVSAYIAQDGSAWIPCKNYSPAIHIKGDIQSASLCADEKHILVLEENGDLYTVSPDKLDKRTDVAQDVVSVEIVRDDGIVYSATQPSGETSYYRWMFKDSAPVQIDAVSVVSGSDHCSLFYSTPDGSVMLFAAGDAQPTYLDKFGGTVDLAAVSSDGKICVLSVTEDSTTTTYLYDAGERRKLNSVDTEYNDTEAIFSQDEELLSVYNTNGTLVYLKKPGEDAVEINLPMALNWEEPMTKSGALSAGSAVDTLYVFVETDDYGLRDLYAVSLDGGREKVQSSIREALFANGRLYYTDAEHILYGADIKENTVENEEKISADVYSLFASPDGKNLCYSKSLKEDETGSLYIYSVEKDESTRVTASASFTFFDLSSINSYIILDYAKFSEDGKYLYYFEDVGDISDNSYSKGTLCRFSLSNGESKTILMDALVYIGTPNYSGSVSSSYFWAEQYFSGDSTGFSCDLVLFAKGEKTNLAQDIFHKMD